MSTNRRGGYVSSASDTVERECDRCEWHGAAGSYPELIKRYQDHLRDEHPTAWLRS
ncbi:hypothetical protein HYG81_16455 [Natrinema zhouii]|uniref:DUF1059 domain-containing protein n=1 Tax=Natrinema zhouii TaxID=1710539 RepID=A0A7D6CPA4_9EURY|nr:hypothetical protein [Natrinema zhouii]QLK25654.1 hypothetical protein HYG81_16455 [Natrinema zhouii]